jgi:hypothetical protein
MSASNRPYIQPVRIPAAAARSARAEASSPRQSRTRERLTVVGAALAMEMFVLGHDVEFVENGAEYDAVVRFTA